MLFRSRRTVSQAEWQAFGCRLKPQEVIDLIGLVAQYVLFALTNNVLQVPVEAALQGVPGLEDD